MHYDVNGRLIADTPAEQAYIDAMGNQSSEQKQTPVSGVTDAVGTGVGMHVGSKIPGLFSSGASAAADGGIIGAGTMAAEVPAGAAIPAGYVGVGTSATGGTMIAPASMAGGAGGGAFSLGGIGAAGNAILPLAGAVGAYDVLTSRRGGWGGAAEGAASGAAMGSYFGLPGAGIGAAIGGLVGYFDKHKTTKQYEAERWKDTNSKFDKDPNQPFVQHLASVAHPEGDTGQAWTPEVAAKALQDPIAMWGTQGMLNTFGPDYFNKMTEFQRYAATKAAIDNGLLKADHGDIIVTDPEKLKSLLESAYSNKDYLSEYNAWKKANPNEIPFDPKNPNGTPSSATTSAKGGSVNINIGGSSGPSKMDKAMSKLNLVGNLMNSRQYEVRPAMGIPGPAQGKSFSEILSSSLGK